MSSKAAQIRYIEAYGEEERIVDIPKENWQLASIIEMLSEELRKRLTEETKAKVIS